MSKLLSAENLMLAFPSSLAEDDDKRALASVTAQELCELYEDNNILAIYARIDELDETMLDILAYDFKIDWWDENYTLEEKRETFKSCWDVKRKLGVPFACYLAISALYQNAEIQEWYNYDGNPFYFKIHIDSGEVLTDCDKLQRVVEGIRYYKNKRSILETIEIDIAKQVKMFIGFALQGGTNVTMRVNGIDYDDYDLLVDELGNLLLDENGLLFTE